MVNELMDLLSDKLLQGFDTLPDAVLRRVLRYLIKNAGNTAKDVLKERRRCNDCQRKLDVSKLKTQNKKPLKPEVQLAEGIMGFIVSSIFIELLLLDPVTLIEVKYWMQMEIEKEGESHDFSHDKSTELIKSATIVSNTTMLASDERTETREDIQQKSVVEPNRKDSHVTHGIEDISEDNPDEKLKINENAHSKEFPKNREIGVQISDTSLSNNSQTNENKSKKVCDNDSSENQSNKSVRSIKKSNEPISQKSKITKNSKRSKNLRYNDYEEYSSNESSFEEITIVSSDSEIDDRSKWHSARSRKIYDRDFGEVARQWKLKFTGENEFGCEIFIDTLRMKFVGSNIPYEKRLVILPEVLKGRALQWYRSFRKDWKSWNDFLSSFRIWFGDDQEKLRNDIRNRKQEPGESVRNYLICLMSLYHYLRRKVSLKIQLDKAYDGLLLEYWENLDRHDVRSYTELLEKTSVIERRGAWRPPPSPSESYVE